MKILKAKLDRNFRYDSRYPKYKNCENAYLGGKLVALQDVPDMYIDSGETFGLYNLDEDVFDIIHVLDDAGNILAKIKP